MSKIIDGFIALLFFLFLSETAGIIGYFVTAPEISTWYAGLVRPSFSPPTVIFGPVWTVLYFMIGLATFFVFRKGWMVPIRQAHDKRALHQKRQAKIGIVFFIMLLILNVAWSVIFFHLHLPVLALIEIVVLFIGIAITMRQFFKVSETAMFLLVPYLLWAFFAIILNCAIVVLN